MTFGPGLAKTSNQVGFRVLGFRVLGLGPFRVGVEGVVEF